MARPQKTREELLAEKSFNFDELLEPYKEGGTKDQPVERTMGTIVDYFKNKKKYPPDVFGGAIMITFEEMKRGKVFKGHGATLPGPHREVFYKPGGYGAPGRELVTYIRVKCDQLMAERHKQEMGVFAQKIIEAAAHRPGWKEKLKRWWFGYSTKAQA
jgi:hypothetical protein